MENMKYVIYARKSTDTEDKQVLSIDSQLNELKELAKRSGIKVEKEDIYTESKSAKAPGRPIFAKMMARVQTGEINGIVCWKLDRLYRNPIDMGAITWAVNDKEVVIVTPQKSYTTIDNLMLYVEGGMANQFILDLSRNVKRGLKTKAEMGWLPSGAKPGYMNDRYSSKGNKKIQSDPIRFQIIKKAWELMLTGAWSPPKIQRYINTEMGYRSPENGRYGGKPMPRSTIYKIFEDTFYFGEFEYAGKIYKGKHEPMITRQDFDRVQILLGKGCSPRPHTREFFASGLIKCNECGGAITAEEKFQIICPVCKQKFASMNKKACPKCETLIENMVNPKLLHYTYYHCAKSKNPHCTQGCVTEEKLMEQVEEYLGKIQISERFKNWAIKRLNRLYDLEKVSRNASIDSFQEDYKKVVNRIDNLVKLKISPQNTDNELLSDDEFKSQKETLMKEKKELEEKMNQTGDRVNQWVELSERTFNFACYAKYWFKNGDLETRKQILLSLSSNLTLKDKIIGINLTKPLQYIVEFKNSDDKKYVVFEPKDLMEDTNKYDGLCDKKLSMLPALEQIRIAVCGIY
ncbi:MAG: recombinase family protein [Candidatus Shapirobacteria bacterium]|jgi:DNA invertase Pin-like site-specific DNA recombinase